MTRVKGHTAHGTLLCLFRHLCLWLFLLSYIREFIQQRGISVQACYILVSFVYTYAVLRICYHIHDRTTRGLR